MICENCGAEMRFKQVGHSISWICNNCGELFNLIHNHDTDEIKLEHY